MRAVIVLVIVALTSSAAADRKKAERLFRAGERAYRAQKFLVAAQNFELAYKEFPAPELAFSAAQAYRRQYRVDRNPDHVTRAINYYEAYLKERKSGGRVGDATDNLESMIRERDRLGAAVKPDAAPPEEKTLFGISVQFADAQQGATQMREVEEGRGTAQTAVTVTIDGKPYEPERLHPIEPGDHVVRVEAAGYVTLEKRVRVIPGEQDSEEVVLEPLPAKITVATEPGATVIVDGRGIGEAPLAPIEVPAGSHVITVLRAGRRAAAREVVVTRAQQLEVAIPLEPTFRRRSVKWVAITGGGLVGFAGFFALGAVYFDGNARDKRALLDAGDAEPEVLDDYNEARANRDRSVTLAWVAGGAAVAVGLTAAWLYYFDTPSAEGVQVVPLATKDGAGAAITGRF